jgi:hypothetical protein
VRGGGDNIPFIGVFGETSFCICKMPLVVYDIPSHPVSCKIKEKRFPQKVVINIYI